MKRAGQIVLFRFPQTDLAQGKLRPALLIGVEERWTSNHSASRSCRGAGVETQGQSQTTPLNGGSPARQARNSG